MLIGPFGTGKTSSACFDQIMLQSKRVRKHPVDGVRYSRFAIVRNTNPQLRDTTIKTVLDWFPPYVFGEYKETAKNYTIKIKGNPDDVDPLGRADRVIELIFRALDDQNDVRNLLSLELTGAWCDEAREIDRSIVLGLLGRIGRYPSMKDYEGKSPFLTPPQVLLTTNYPSTLHWLYKDFVSMPIDGWMKYEQSQQENIHNLRPGYYDDLEKDYADRPDLLRTLVRGQWGITVQGKEVYPEFNRKIHVATFPLIPLRATQVIVGWDNTGLSPAINLSYISEIGQWRIFKEFCFENVSMADATDSLLTWCEATLPKGCKFRHIGDPAGKNRDSNKQSPADYISGKARDHGQVITIEDGIQTFKIRKDCVAGRLGIPVLGEDGRVISYLPRMIDDEPAMLIDPSCDVILNGFEGGYAYKEIGKTGTFQPDPIKNEFSHVHDSIQYVGTRLFPVKRARTPLGQQQQSTGSGFAGFM